MANNKHLTLDERITIETMLNQKASITLIANALNKHPTTISKEIRNRLIFKRIGAMKWNKIANNDCLPRQCIFDFDLYFFTDFKMIMIEIMYHQLFQFAFRHSTQMTCMTCGTR